jgi:hypothetical protein
MANGGPAASQSPGVGGGAGRPFLVKLVRLFGALLVVGLSLALSYVIAINVFLSTSLFSRVVNAKPDVIDVHYQRAWSLVPWKVHAKTLSIRGRDSNVEWILRLDEVEFDPSFFALTKSRFDAKHVRGKGISFRLRSRLQAAPESQEEVADLPPVEGFPRYSIRPPPSASPGDWNDAAYHLWTVHLEDVVADDVRELWISHTRLEGSTRIEGRFFLKPVRAVEVGPVRVAVAKGTVRTGAGPVADELDGSSLEVRVARFDPRIVHGADIVSRVSLDADAHGVVPELARLPPFSSRVTVRGVARVRKALLHVRSGVLRSSSDLEVTAAPLELSSGEHHATGALTLQANITRNSGDPLDRFTFRAEASDVEAFHRLQPTVAFFRVPRVELNGDARALGVLHPLGDLHVVVELPQSEVPDVRALSRYIPAGTPVAIRGGRAQATGRVEVWLAERRATGSASLHAGDLDLRIAKVRVRGRASLRQDFSSYHFDTHELDEGTIALTVSKGSLSSDAAPNLPLVHVRGLRVNGHGRHVDLDDPLRALDVTIAMPDADIAAPDLLRAYLPQGAETQPVSGQSRFSLAGTLVISDHRARGALDIESKAMTFAHRDLRLDAGLRLRVRVHEWRWETGDASLDDARLEVGHATVTKRDSEGRGTRPVASFARIAVEARSSRFDFGNPLSKLSMSASIVNGKVQDPTGLRVFLPDATARAIESKEGSFEVDVRADVERHIAKGTVHARASHMGAGSKALHLKGDIDLLAQVADWDFDKNTMKLTDGRVTVTGVEGRFRAGGPPDFSAGRVALELSTPMFDLERPTLQGGSFHLVVDKAILPDARRVDALLPPASDLAIESGSARGSADLVVSSPGRAAAGSVDISLAHGVVRLRDARLSGDFSLHAGLRGFRPEDHRLGLSTARIQMRNVAVSGASATTSGWRGNATLTGASLRLGAVPEVDGIVGLEARDARPILAVLFGKGLPKLIVRIADVPRLIGSARITAGANGVSVLDLDAGGGDLGLRANYVAAGGHRRGGVILRKWFLSGGLRLDDHGAHLRLWGLDGWMRDQRRAAMKLLNAGSAGTR